MRSRMRLGREGRVEVEDPAPSGVEARRQGFEPVAEPAEVAVLELHGRRVRGGLREGHLEFRLKRRVVLPLSVDLPQQQEPVWRIPRDDATPLALGTVDALLVPPAAGSW